MPYNEFAVLAARWIRDGNAIPHMPFEDDTMYHAHQVCAVTDAAITAGSTATAVPELDCPLRFAGGRYIFEYNLIYSISGLAVGAQFGIDLVAGGSSNIGYTVLMAADGSSLRSASTTTAGALIGSGSSFGGGGPWSVTITGAVSVPPLADPVARLRFKGSGIGVSVTLQPNSTAWFQEV